MRHLKYLTYIKLATIFQMNDFVCVAVKNASNDLETTQNTKKLEPNQPQDLGILME